MLARSFPPEQMERFSRANFLLIVVDPDTSQPTTTVTRRTAQTIPYHFSFHLFLSLSLSPPSLRLSPSDRLTHTHTYTMQNVQGVHHVWQIYCSNETIRWPELYRSFAASPPANSLWPLFVCLPTAPIKILVRLNSTPHFDSGNACRWK